MKTILIRLPDALHREIKIKAAMEERSMSDIIISGIKRELEATK